MCPAESSRILDARSSRLIVRLLQDIARWLVVTLDQRQPSSSLWKDALFYRWPQVVCVINSTTTGTRPTTGIRSHRIWQTLQKWITGGSKLKEVKESRPLDVHLSGMNLPAARPLSDRVRFPVYTVMASIVAVFACRVGSIQGLYCGALFARCVAATLGSSRRPRPMDRDIPSLSTGSINISEISSRMAEKTC
nr:hypothetical protein CFP56_02974 [Quercus suber]